MKVIYPPVSSVSINMKTITTELSLTDQTRDLDNLDILMIQELVVNLLYKDRLEYKTLLVKTFQLIVGCSCATDI